MWKCCLQPFPEGLRCHCKHAVLSADGDIPVRDVSSVMRETQSIKCCVQAAELPVLDEDRQLDADSNNTGEQQFEKLTAGLYMGDIARRLILRYCPLFL